MINQIFEFLYKKAIYGCLNPESAKFWIQKADRPLADSANLTEIKKPNSLQSPNSASRRFPLAEFFSFTRRIHKKTSPTRRIPKFSHQVNCRATLGHFLKLILQ